MGIQWDQPHRIVRIKWRGICKELRTLPGTQEALHKCYAVTITAPSPQLGDGRTTPHCSRPQTSTPSSVCVYSPAPTVAMALSWPMMCSFSRCSRGKRRRSSASRFRCFSWYCGERRDGRRLRSAKSTNYSCYYRLVSDQPTACKNCIFRQNQLHNLQGSVQNENMEPFVQN